MIRRPPISTRTACLCPYTTLFCSLGDWADAHCRRRFDRSVAGHPEINMSAAGGMDGCLPTHISDCSLAPTGDLEHDTAHCRNGRILLDDTDMAAKRSTAPFFMTVYRQEGDGINYVTVRNVYMPAEIGRASCRERVCQYV